MTREQAMKKLALALRQQQQHPNDDSIMKSAHLDADIVIYEFLCSNGFEDIAHLWDQVEGCYD